MREHLLAIQRYNLHVDEGCHRRALRRGATAPERSRQHQRRDSIHPGRSPCLVLDAQPKLNSSRRNPGGSNGAEVVFSYARSVQKLERLAREAQGNTRSGTPAEAARAADALLLAVHWSRVDEVLKQAGDLAGKVIISCSLPMNASDTALVVGQSSSGASSWRVRLPRPASSPLSARCRTRFCSDVYERRQKSNRPSLVYCGDDHEAKDLTAGLIWDVGFDPVDAGPLKKLPATRSRSLF
jgi:hypothetical protein